MGRWLEAGSRPSSKPDLSLPHAYRLNYSNNIAAYFDGYTQLLFVCTIFFTLSIAFTMR
jgi:hypothetical protein